MADRRAVVEVKPAPFRYFAPTSLDEVLGLLREHGWDAKLLAGGQSLIPAMNFRLAQPAVLIDLNGVGGLDGIEETADGGVRIGAMSRHSAVERDPTVAGRAPLVFETMPHVAHPQIRNRGTFGGSIAHADPAAELPAVCVARRARFRVRGAEGERTIAAEEFFLGLLMTAMQPDEVLIAVDLPPLPARTGTAFDEVARRHGDYALVGVATTLTVDEDGRCADPRIALLSVGEGPTLASQAMAALAGQPATAASFDEAATIASLADIDPPGDLHATPAYRRHLTRVMLSRSLARAAARATAAATEDAS